MQKFTIESPNNPKIKQLKQLHEQKYRKKQQRFLIEGNRELNRAIENNASIEAIFISTAHNQSESAQKLEQICQTRNIEIYPTAPAAFQKASLRQNPDGFLALAKTWNTPLHKIPLSKTPLILIAEKIEKPGNLGSLLRTADAAGANAVILTDSVVDCFNPNVVRNSQGSLFSIPISSSDNEQTQTWLATNNIQIVTTSPNAGNSLWQADMTRPTAILIGSEKDGLSPFWLDATPPHTSIHIPQKGSADSLNASISAALVLFEAVRQRSSTPAKPAK